MAIIIKRSSPGDKSLQAEAKILSRGDVVNVKFYHVVTKFYHYVTLKMIFGLREIHLSDLLILSGSKGALLLAQQRDIRRARGENVAVLSPLLNTEKVMLRLCYCI